MAGIGGEGEGGGGGLVGGSALYDELKRSDVVRLRGLPFSATEEEIADFFKGLELGPDGVVICVNFQGRSTGQAYVQFASAEVANKALERNRQHMGNRYIEVFKGHQADMQGALRMVGRGNTIEKGSGNISNARIPGMSGNPDPRYAGVIRMRGMPYSCTSADVTAFFKGMQIVPDGIFLSTHADGRPTGEAYVEFVDEETATRAMELHKEPMGSRYVELFRSNKGEMVTAVQQRMYGMFTGFGAFGNFGQFPGMMGGFGGFPGMNLAVMQAGLFGPGDPSENVCIKLRGLPFHAGVKEIVEFFQGYSIAPGGIHILTGAADRPTGEAFVEFINSEEAQRAMERQRQNIGTRYIELFRATKGEMHLAVGGLPGFGMGHILDPSVQLFLLQQQAAAGTFGMGGLMGAQGGAKWAEMQNTPAASSNYFQRQTGLAASVGNAVFDPSAAGKIRPPYRSL